MSELTGQFECWIVGQGKGMLDFQKSLGADTVASFKWYPFVAPWEMPELLNNFDAIFIFESGLPHSVVSNLALEAIFSGIGIITDRADFIESYRDIVEIGKTVLKEERIFNLHAGFSPSADRLPDFFKEDPLPPSNSVFEVPDIEIDSFWDF